MTEKHWLHKILLKVAGYPILLNFMFLHTYHICAHVVLWLWSPQGSARTGGSEVGGGSESIITPVVHTGPFPGVIRGVNSSIGRSLRNTTVDCMECEHDDA